MLINVSQINPTQFALAVQQYGSGAAFSGNVINYVTNSGFLGNTVVYTTGGNQDITGIKTFRDSPRVPYSGTTGTAPSARWVNDQVIANNTSLVACDAATSGYALAISGALSAVRVSGSAVIRDVNLSGIGSLGIFTSGGILFFSGGAGGGGPGGGSDVSVTGSSTLSSVNLTGAGSVVVSYVVETGPGAPPPYVLISGSSVGGGGGSPDAVTTTGNEVIGGFKQFTGSPFVPDPTQPSGAANLEWTSGVSGILRAFVTGVSGAIQAGTSVTNNYFITGTGVVAASSTGSVTNTFNITSGSTFVTSSGTVTNNFNGGVTNNTNISGVTGNFVNMSFYLDEFSLATGLNLIESFVGRSFTFTGYGVGVINTGTQGFLSGSFYQRTSINTKTNFVDFSLNSGTFWYASGGFNQVVSGLNRVGLDIYRIGTGITGLSVGLFGVGY